MIKMIAALCRRPGMTHAECLAYVQHVHGALATEEPAGLRRCVHHHQLPEFNPMLAYFGGQDVPIYEGVASLWFDDATCLGAFRAYERALLAINAEPGNAFYRPAQSFFVYATEVPIYERRAV